jgi:acyl-CoA thioesterase-2
MDYCVERVRDGRTAAVRTVTAVQDGRPALTMTASFQTTDAVAHSQLEMPPVVDAELAPVGMRGPVEVRPVVWSGRSGEAAPRQLIWMRCPTELPDDPRAHAAAVTFASDLTLGWSPWKALGVHRVVEPMFGASIDHAMWFHAPVRFDDWLLVDQGSQAVAGDRGLAVASVYDRSGRMVMTTAQEGLMRGIAAAALNARDLFAADVEGDCDDDVFRIA